MNDPRQRWQVWCIDGPATKVVATGNENAMRIRAENLSLSARRHGIDLQYEALPAPQRPEVTP
jgi:hypothetical protein